MKQDIAKAVIFRGDTGECLTHLGQALAEQAPKGSRQVRPIRQPMADFCGVSVESVGRWFRSDGARDQLPTGVPLLKLWCYLTARGYQVIEFERLPTGIKSFVDLIGWGVLSSEEATRLLGYSESSTLFRVLQGRGNASGDRRATMREIWSQHREALEQRKRQFVTLRSVDPAAVLPPTVTPIRPAATSGEAVANRRTSGRHQSTALHLMQALIELLEKEGFSELPDDQITVLRTEAPRVLRLSAILSTLSARLVTPPRKGGG